LGLIPPPLPHDAQEFGARPTLTGCLVPAYAAAQLAEAPILSRLANRLGRRPALLASVPSDGYGQTDWRSANRGIARMLPRFGFRPIAYRLVRRIDARIAWASRLNN